MEQGLFISNFRSLIMAMAMVMALALAPALAGAQAESPSCQLEVSRLKILEALNRFTLLQKVDVEELAPSQLKEWRERAFSSSLEMMPELAEAEKDLRDMDLFEHNERGNRDYTRLAPIYWLAKKIYAELDPQDEYTQLTDGEGVGRRGHYWIVANLLPKPIPLTTVAAAFFHDIERFIPAFKVPYEDLGPLVQLKGKNLDTFLRKEVTHPHRSAQVVTFLLKGASLDSAELARLDSIIRYHDASAKGVKVNLSDGETLVLLPEIKEENLKREIEILSDADATAFFYMTLPPFVEREMKKMEKWPSGSQERGNLEENLKMRIIQTLYGRISSKELKERAKILAQAHIKNDGSPLDNFVKKIISQMD